MTEDRFKGTGEFHPDRAWGEIQRKDWERKHERGSRHGGWLAVAFVGCVLVFVVSAIGFLLGLPQLLRNIF
ncbi:hypothetical protein GCM10027214_16670 [Stenotrophomonas tumulicola]